MDPNVYTSKSGVRYKWIFLAKSHVKKKNAEFASRTSSIMKGGGRERSGSGGNGEQSAPMGGEKASFGCLVCSVQGRVSGVYGDVESLMGHVRAHAGMDRELVVRAGGIVGREAGQDEEWDFNILENGVDGGF